MGDTDNYPRLNYRLTYFVVARDRAAKMTKLGGLGVMGVGEMWSVDEPHYEEFYNWETCPEEKCTEYPKCLAEGPTGRCWGVVGHEGQHHRHTVSWS